MCFVLINKKAKREYEILDTYVAGIVLSGPEVKSLRLGRANIGDAYADPREGEIWLINCHISEYFNAQKEFQFSPTRPRKLLLHKKEIRKLQGSVQKQGLTLIVLNIFLFFGLIAQNNQISLKTIKFDPGGSKNNQI